MKKFFKNNKKSLRRVSALVLAFIFSVSAFGCFLDSASMYANAEQSNTYYYVWHRCRSADDIRSYMVKGSSADADSYEMFNHRLMLLYGTDDDWSSPTYIVNGAKTDSDNRAIYATKISSSDGINYNAETFTTINNFNTPFIKYSGKDAGNKTAFTVRFMPESTPVSYDSNYEVATRNKEKAAGSNDAYYGRMTKTALEASKLYVYNCWVLHGGAQSATFFPKLVSKKSSEADTGNGFYADYSARNSNFVFLNHSDDDDIKDGYMTVYTYRKWLLDASLTHDGSELDMCYYDNDEEEWFMVFVSTLEERPAICASDVYKGYTTNFIESTTIKQGVTLTVTDNAVLRLSGEITNLGMFVVKEGGTLIIDYDAVLKTDPTAQRQNGASPGTIRVESGGQLIVLEGAVVSMPRNVYGCVIQTDDFNIYSGGTAFIAGTILNGNATNIYGQLYMTGTGVIKQGYSPDLQQTTLSPTGKMMNIDAGTSLLTLESGAKIECSMGVSWPAGDDKGKYTRYGGIKYGDLIFYDEDNINGYGSKLNETYKSGDYKYNLSSVISYTPNATADFAAGKMDAMLSLYKSGGTSALSSKFIDDGVIYDKIEDTPSYKALDSTSALYADDLSEVTERCRCTNYIYSTSAITIEGVDKIEVDCSGNEKTSGC